MNNSAGSAQPEHYHSAFKFDHVHIISENPKVSAEWYVEMFGARIAREGVAYGAPQIAVELGGMTVLIRGKRPGEEPAAARPIRPYDGFSSHNELGTMGSASS